MNKKSVKFLERSEKSVVSNNTAKIQPQKRVVKYFGRYFARKTHRKGDSTKHTEDCRKSRRRLFLDIFHTGGKGRRGIRVFRYSVVFIGLEKWKNPLVIVIFKYYLLQENFFPFTLRFILLNTWNPEYPKLSFQSEFCIKYFVWFALFFGRNFVYL